MARGVNKVILIGTLGADPEVKYMPNGNAVCNISIATNESWKDKQTGQMQERTEWHRVVAFQRLAEIIGEYLRKGSQVYIEGKLQTRKWQAQDGQDRYTTEIRADNMQMLGSPAGGGNNTSGGYNRNQGTASMQQNNQQQAGGYNQQAAPQQNAAPQQAASPNNAQSAPASQAPGFEDFDDDIPF